MGWRGAIRSINAASNRAAKERDRNLRFQAKETEKLSKKLQDIKDKKEKIKEALNNEYAAGKISSDQYALLSKRMEDISDELIIFGKVAGVTVGKRYVCGKIEKEEFEKLRSELVPAELYRERDLVLSQVGAIQKNITDFKKSCVQKDGFCSKCSKPKGLFRHLKEIDGMIVCGACTKNYEKLKYYNGFRGTYITANPCEVEDQMSISLAVRKEYY